MEKEDIKNFYEAMDNKDFDVLENYFGLYGKECLEVADAFNGAYTPLTKSSWNGALDVVRFLVEKGADVNASDKTQTPLMRAVMMGKQEIVDYLLKNGADVNCAGLEEKDTPLLLASRHGQVDIAETLVASGADVNARNATGETALYAAVNHDIPKIAEFLLEHGADPSPYKSTDKNRNPAWIAISRFNFEMLDLLIKHGAKDDAAFHMAVSYGMLDVATALLKNDPGAIKTDPNVFSEGLAGCLTICVLASSTEISANRIDPVLRLLLRHGADVNCRNEGGYTPLHLAARSGCLGMMKALIDAGADIFAVGSDGKRIMDLINLNERGDYEHKKSNSIEELTSHFKSATASAARKVAGRTAQGLGKPIAVKPVRLVRKA